MTMKVLKWVGALACAYVIVVLLKHSLTTNDYHANILTYLIQRLEWGPRPVDESAGRVYLLLDLGWLYEWRPQPGSLYGRSHAGRLHWAAGAGISFPSRAGDLRLDYAVPGGAGFAQGRIHFGYVSRF